MPKGLEVHGDTSGLWVRCKKCSCVLCPVGDDWQAVCRETISKHLCCPSCGAIVEQSKE